MKEKPILFNGEMVRAILDGRKTQTRRVIKPQPTKDKIADLWWINDDHFHDDESMRSHLFHDVYGNDGCPYGGVYADGTADTLWVRETWKPDHSESDIVYMADGGRKRFLDRDDWFSTDWEKTKRRENRDRSRPSIHMPRWASRINLEVKDIRIERVQDITYEGMKAEGCFPPEICGGFWAKLQEEYWIPLWDSINKKRGFSWESNPWVWVVDFKELVGK